MKTSASLISAVGFSLIVAYCGVHGADSNNHYEALGKGAIPIVCCATTIKIFLSRCKQNSHWQRNKEGLQTTGYEISSR